MASRAMRDQYGMLNLAGRIKKNVALAQAWIERASKLHPVSEMQLWHLREKLGAQTFRKIDLTRVILRP